MARSSTLKKVGEAVRAARNGRGLTQAVVAERAELAVETISRIESGDVNISIVALDKLAVSGLGVSVVSLFEHVPKLVKPPGRTGVARIVALVEDLADEDLADVHLALRALLRVRSRARSSRSVR